MINEITQDISPITALPDLLSENRPAAVNLLVEIELPRNSIEMKNLVEQLNTFKTEVNTTVEAIEIVKDEAEEAKDITVAAKDEALTAVATLQEGAIDDTTIAINKAFSNSYIQANYYDKTEVYNKTEVNDALDNIISLPIGAILNGFTIFDNCIVAFGGEFNRADYPKLWEYLQANPSLVKTQAQWTTESTANGGICGFFSDGNGATTFRVPNLDKAFLRPDSRGVASFQGDAIRNITGRFPKGSDSDFSSTTGPFFKDIQAPTGGGSGNNRYMVGFNASRVVPTAPENRPKNIAVLPLIVAK